MILLKVYPAGEEVIPSADSKVLARTIRLSRRLDPIFSESIDEAISILLSTLQDEDIVLVMGAGSVGNLSKILVSRFNQLHQEVSNG